MCLASRGFTTRRLGGDFLVSGFHAAVCSGTTERDKNKPLFASSHSRQQGVKPDADVVTLTLGW
jgi:hypothetical protein